MTIFEREKMVYQNILTAFDGSKLSFLAFKKAINLAKKAKANLDIIAVIDNQLLKDVSSFDTDALHRITDGVKNQISSLVEKAKEKNIVTNKYIELGNPKIIISQDRFANPHDLIVMGATGMSKVEKLFVGSVTEYVVQHSSCNCLIVKK